jgi:alkanesulfonate monooxygenase SsuD/methylene tetrahydromethanopterin reductase-like flavin-dependent oxidoreductase (luciferase family)
MPAPTRRSNGLTAVGEVEVQGAGVACGVLLPNFDPERLGGLGRNSVLQAARLAEQLEFESLWAGDHLACPAPGLDAPTCIAASAAVTERIALGFSVMLLGLRNPAWTAKQLASIDLLAGGGRLRLGVGAGGEFPAEFEAAGVPVSQRGARLDDSLAVIGDLLTGQPVDYTGRALTVRAAGLEPPLPAVPPIYVGGRGEPALRRAARYGDAWMPMWLTPARIAERSQRLGEMALEHGRPAPRVTPLILVRIDADRNHAYAQARAHIAGQYRMELDTVERWTLLDSIDGAVEHLHQFVEVGVSEILLLTLGRDPLDQYERLAEVRARLRAPAAAAGTAP